VFAFFDVKKMKAKEREGERKRDGQYFVFGNGWLMITSPIPPKTKK